MKNPFADTSTLDFIAASIYADDCHKKNSHPVRWLCLDEKLQKNYLEQASARYVDWTENERAAQVRRAGP